MTEQPQNSNENPLDDWAEELSEMLGESPINLEQSDKTLVQGGQVHMRQSSAREIDAHALHMDESAAGLVKAQSVDANDSLIGAAVAETMSLKNTNSSILAAGTVDASEVKTVALFATRVNGNVQTAITPFTALLVGAGLGISLFVTKRIAGRFFASSNKVASPNRKQNTST